MSFKLVGVITKADEVFCANHLPEGLDPNDENACVPLYAHDEWVDENTVCQTCWHPVKEAAES